MDTQTVIYPRNGILFTNKEEQIINTCYNLGELQKHYAKWKKPKKQQYCMISLYEMSKKGKSIETENKLVAA